MRNRPKCPGCGRRMRKRARRTWKYGLTSKSSNWVCRNKKCQWRIKG
jgi:hypothetical protein